MTTLPPLRSSIRLVAYHQAPDFIKTAIGHYTKLKLEIGFLKVELDLSGAFKNLTVDPAILAENARITSLKEILEATEQVFLSYTRQLDAGARLVLREANGVVRAEWYQNVIPVGSVPGQDYAQYACDYDLHPMDPID
jgi:hypothetical protein